MTPAERAVALRERIASLKEINDTVQSLHPETFNLKMVGIVRRQVAMLTEQLVSELERRLINDDKP